MTAAYTAFLVQGRHKAVGTIWNGEKKAGGGAALPQLYELDNNFYFV